MKLEQRRENGVLGGMPAAPVISLPFISYGQTKYLVRAELLTAGFEMTKFMPLMYSYDTVSDCNLNCLQIITFFNFQLRI